MNLQEIFTSGGGMLLILFTLVQISPIKINPWSWLAKKFGRAVNGEVIEKVDNLGKDLKSLRGECDEREAINCRTRIMRFGDELLHDVRHSKEHFDQILLDITNYEIYCEAHPHFRNNIAVATIENIKVVYQKCMKENNFL